MLELLKEGLLRLSRLVLWKRRREIPRGTIRARTTDLETVPQITTNEVAEYWTGRGVDYRRIWAAYDVGQSGYIRKYKSRSVHLFIIEFNFPPSYLPLADHEAVLKSLKGIFHDLKRENLSSAEYNDALPLFLYSVERGSGIYKFLGEFRQLLMFGTVLGDEKIMDAHLENKQKRIDFLLKNFPSVDPKTAQRFVMAKTNYEMDEALEKLMNKGIKSIKISAEAAPHELSDKNNVKLIELKTPAAEEPTDTPQ